MPKRIQRKRASGWRMPVGAVYVGRPGRFGNPWQAVNEAKWGNGWVVLDPDWLARPQRHYCTSERVARRFAVWKYRRFLSGELLRIASAGMLAELRGHDLACWCPLDRPCHGDVLLELANT